jgi:hypothetical protein
MATHDASIAAPERRPKRSGTRQRQSQNPDRLTYRHVATPSISPENTPDIEFIRTLRSALQSGCNEWPPLGRLRRFGGGPVNVSYHRSPPSWRHASRSVAQR